MIVAAVPLKQLSEAKSRLAPHLSPRERSSLAVALLERAVGALRESGAVDRIALVSVERALGRRLGLEVLPERGGLNASLVGAVAWARQLDASALLILHADLPLIAAEDVVLLTEALDGRDGIALAPTRDGGTSGLLLTPPDVIPPSFGPASYGRHVRLASRRGVAVGQVTSAGFLQDMDTAEDLEALAAIPLHPG